MKKRINRLSPEQRRLRLEKSRAERYNYLLAHTYYDAADYFMAAWDSPIDTSKKFDPEIKTFEKKNSKEQIFANDAMNKFTEYGNKVALNYLLSIPEVQRVCEFALYDFEELQSLLAKGFNCEMQKEIFLTKRNIWFSHLKERMFELRISKETMQSFGLNWKEVKTFAYQTI